MAGSYSHLSCGALTDVGVRRKNNEDFIKPLPEHGVFCVADGMGGVQGGEVASQAAVTWDVPVKSRGKAFGAKEVRVFDLANHAGPNCRLWPLLETLLRAPPYDVHGETRVRQQR